MDRNVAVGRLHQGVEGDGSGAEVGTDWAGSA